MIPSEFRKDPISGEWILFSPGRFHGVEDAIKKRGKRKHVSLETCPFEKPFQNVDTKVLLKYPEDGALSDWKILILQNKYPALVYEKKRIRKDVEKSVVFPGVGHHDLLITKAHSINFSDLAEDDAYAIFEAFRNRYLMLFTDKNLSYISIFQNWGPLAGATVYHPHFQIMGIPVIPPDVERVLNGARRYMRANGRCVFCDMIKKEKKERKRIIFENNKAIAFAPLVSRNEFEVRIFPKNHNSYFENALSSELDGVVKTLQKVLGKIKKNLGDPDYNLLIHTSPMKNKPLYKSFHWHVEIRPVWNLGGGFEKETGIEVNVVDPDLAAKIIRK